MDRQAGPQFRDRGQAGALLGEHLVERGMGSGSIVLGLLRGGIPVAAALAARLGAPLGALAVRKLGVPQQEEVAFGAVASYRSCRGRYLVRTVHQHVLGSRAKAVLEEVESRATAELDRLARRFADYAPDITGAKVVLCDDGLATGATMHAAVDVAAQCGAQEVIVAVPVAPRVLARSMAGASSVVCLLAPREFSAVGSHYEDFWQVDEDAVERLLLEAREARGQHDARESN
ncbi:phosphoribosyl transferase [Paeniglutamicibacter sp. ABSL32-1]|uniref:phosphoribosyltransferase n=1 Tax=Paeniglutamicibacter quisquiliarum TaxID=2849498 RepID=UPI001C2D516B|nr:phosphoribosyltransferase family protein [Paeniglutamicibacter quisquiliarum]MBV1779707.1 phosphoribosyl transferase [Paeniglutamicibacter quisquiliarum]